MLRPQTVHQTVKTLVMPDPVFAPVGGWDTGAARFRDSPVVVPLDISNVVVGQKAVQRLKKIFLHVRATQVQNKLGAGQGRLAVRVVVSPIGVSPVKVTIGVDHFRLDPDTELHAEVVYMPD